MTDAQTMKLRQIVSNYSVKEDDNLRHIDNAGKPREGTNNQQNIEIEVLHDEQQRETASTGL